MGDVARAVVGEPFDGLWQTGHRPEPVFDRRNHQVLHVLTLDPLGRGHMPQHLPIAAIQRKSHSHLLAIVTADLEPVRAPAQIGALHGHTPVVPALLGPARMSLKEQAMGLHDPVDPLVIGRSLALLLRLAYQKSVHASVAVGRQAADDDFDRRDEILVRLRRPAPALGWPTCHLLGDVRASDLERGADRAHREPPLGHDSERNSCFFGPVATSSASLRISASSVFLPSSRCSSRIWFCRARYSEAATTSSWALVAVSAPCAASLRQRNSWLGATPCRRATRLTVASGS